MRFKVFHLVPEFRPVRTQSSGGSAKAASNPLTFRNARGIGSQPLKALSPTSPTNPLNYGIAHTIESIRHVSQFVAGAKRTSALVTTEAGLSVAGT